MTGPVPRSRLSRATVVDMAATIADTEGLDAVSLSRIAVDAGVKQPALYRHVSGIDDLLVQLSLRARRLLAAGLSEAIGSLRRDDAVLAVAHAWRNFVREHPGLYAATDRVPSVGDPKVEQSLTNVVSTLASALDGYTLGGTASTLRAEPPEFTPRVQRAGEGRRSSRAVCPRPQPGGTRRSVLSRHRVPRTREVNQRTDTGGSGGPQAFGPKSLGWHANTM